MRCWHIASPLRPIGVCMPPCLHMEPGGFSTKPWYNAPQISVSAGLDVWLAVISFLDASVHCALLNVAVFCPQMPSELNPGRRCGWLDLLQWVWVQESQRQQRAWENVHQSARIASCTICSITKLRALLQFRWGFHALPIEQGRFSKPQVPRNLLRRC